MSEAGSRLNEPKDCQTLLERLQSSSCGGVYDEQLRQQFEDFKAKFSKRMELLEVGSKKSCDEYSCYLLCRLCFRFEGDLKEFKCFVQSRLEDFHSIISKQFAKGNRERADRTLKASSIESKLHIQGEFIKQLQAQVGEFLEILPVMAGKPKSSHRSQKPKAGSLNPLQRISVFCEHQRLDSSMPNNVREEEVERRSRYNLEKVTRTLRRNANHELHSETFSKHIKRADPFKRPNSLLKQ